MNFIQMDDVRKKAKDLEASVLSLSSGSHNTDICSASFMKPYRKHQ